MRIIAIFRINDGGAIYSLFGLVIAELTGSLVFGIILAALYLSVFLSHPRSISIRFTPPVVSLLYDPKLPDQICNRQAELDLLSGGDNLFC